MMPFRRKKFILPSDPGSKRPRKPLKKTLFPILIGLFLIVFGLSFMKDHISWVGGFPVFKKAKKEEEKTQPVELPIPVKVYKVAKVSFRDTLPALGTIKGFREYDLKFAVAGNIEYINFKEGERITQGDIIASLDQKEQLLKLEYSKIEADKQAKLYELGSVAESKMKQTQLEYQSAKAELDKTNLIAISDGYIGQIDVDKGAYVSPQDRVGTFVDVKDVFVEFGIIEKDASKVKEGQNVEVTIDTYPDQVFKGQVDSISPMIEGRTRTLRVRTKISNVDEKMKPGMFGRTNALVYEKDQAIVIPSSAFKKKDDQSFVYLVHQEEAAPAEEAPAAEAATAAQPQPKKKGGLDFIGTLFKGKGKKDAAAGAADGAGAIPGMPADEPAAPPPPPEEPESIFGNVEVRPIEVSYATPDAIEVKEGLEEGDLVVMDIEQELQDKARVEVTETQEGIF